MRTSFVTAFPRLRAAAAAAAICLAASACGPRSADTAADPDAQEESEDERLAMWPQGSVVPVEIQNRHSNDVVIYIVDQGRRQRVGLAIAASSTYLRLPVHQLSPGNSLTLMGYAIGMARRLQSDRMTVMPGQRVVWTIENGFYHASAAVWE
jgi:hypothetical protein